MIKCPNPKCGSLIPDDSKFCPDCGKPVKNETEIRKKAGHIANTYKNGYDYYVSQNILPHYSIRLTIENCEKIISMETTIKNRDKEINDKNLEVRKNRARRIIDSYPRGYEYWVSKGVIQRFSDFFSPTWEQIIANEQNIIQKQREIEKSERDRREAEKRRAIDERNRKIEIDKENAFKLRNQITSDYSGTNVFFSIVLGSIAFGVLWYIICSAKNDFSLNGLDIGAFASMIFIWGMFSFGFFILLEPSNKKKIEKWKREHPNDPRNSFLI